MIFIRILTLTLNAQTDKEETVIFSRIGELSDEELNNSGASKLTFVTDEKEAKKRHKKISWNLYKFI